MPRKKVVTPEVVSDTHEDTATEPVLAPAPKPRVRRPRTKTTGAPVVAALAPLTSTAPRVVARRRSSTPAFVVATLSMLAVVGGSAVLIGKMDRGEIDVNAAIVRSNEANPAAGGDPANNVPIVADELRNLPNGGLVPQENQPAPTPPPTEASTTASSTESADPESEITNTSTEAEPTEAPETTTAENTQATETQ